MQTPLIAALLVAAAGHSLAEPDAATGIVYHDANADGARQTGEPGLEGVAVTNGRDVVRTDADGRYTLTVSDDTIITVIKPAGYQVPLDDLNLPRHSYIHKPKGSPDDGFLFKGVEPTGPLPDSIDFGLTQTSESESFSVIVFADPQPYSFDDLQAFRREVIDPLARADDAGTPGNVHGAAFGISLGDLVGDQLDFFGPLNQAQAHLGVPWYNVYGNHDMNFLAGDSSLTAEDPDRYADETYERVYGSPNYAFQYGKAHFIVLDNVIYQGFDGWNDGEYDLWPGGRWPKTGNYRGGLRPDQIDFVRSYLAGVPTDHLVVLAMHVPLEGTGVHRVPEQRALFDALSSHPNTLSLSGHTHLQRHWFFGAEHGYSAETTDNTPNQHTDRDPNRFPEPVHHHLNAVTASGSWYRGGLDEYGLPNTQMRDGAPNGYTLLTIDGNRYTTDFIPSRRGQHHRMAVHIDNERSTLTVNIFNGAPGDNVVMRLLGNTGPVPGWTEMNFTPGTDPLYAELVARENAHHGGVPAGARPVPSPVDSHHLWSAPIPTDLPNGTHMIEIRHTDLYGREHRHHHSIQVGGFEKRTDRHE